ncbi:SH3 domain-containing protein [Afifella marina]|uniref:SH3 domain-containing protein n=1 Tax=Afifella marina TaxID=1080 RepID=UPI001113A6C2|nr:SH3 domain-containing protein [Afifella marina]
MPRLAHIRLTVSLIVLGLSGLSSSALAADAALRHDAVIRALPNDASEVLGDVSRGSEVVVNGCAQAEGWCLVRPRSGSARHGWLRGDALTALGFSRRSDIGDDAVINIEVGRPVTIIVLR